MQRDLFYTPYYMPSLKSYHDKQKSSKLRQKVTLKWKGLDIHVLDKNTNLYILVPLTISLCMAIGNDLINKFTKLSKDPICVTINI